MLPDNKYNGATTFLFYDLETSGLNQCFDQVFQFAAIRTDENLKELARHEIFVKLSPDTIPSPQALLTHRLSISKLNQIGISEGEAIKKIHALLNERGTISIGYNTLNFDDEFLRFSFYRNLLPPYTHQYSQNGCGRMDIYPIAVLYYLYRNHVMSWPKLDEEFSLRLDHLNAVNKLVDGDAHNAMHDVEATLALARIFHHDQKGWDYVRKFFSKDEDQGRIQELPLAFDSTITNYPYRLALLINGSFGKDNLFQKPVLGLGGHNHFRNQSLWLKLDDPTLNETKLNNIPEKTGVMIARKKLGEAGFLLPMTPKRCCHLSSARQEIIKENLKWLSKNQDVLAAISNYHREYKYPLVPDADLDTTLYVRGFFSEEEIALMRSFHDAALNEKLLIMDHFQDQNLREQALRFLGRNHFVEIPAELQDHFNLYLRRNFSKDKEGVIRDFRGRPKLTPQGVVDEITQLKVSGNLSPADLTLLDEVEQYISMRLGELRRINS